MAISYTLDVKTPLSAAQVAGELHRVAVDVGLLAASTSETGVLDPGVVTTSGTWFRVIATPPSPWPPALTSFGFRPTVTAVFRFDKFGDIDTQTDDMIKLVSDLLGRVPGDLVLHCDLEEVWLLRSGDETVISDQDDLWPPHRTSLLAPPHHRKPLAFTG
ncbi:SitI3 family protein [Saccharothrix deserti]|uniref:SitI3 family protein n=1 Tax=Saccharothrix deserti TaxID=2593674 RepID=UPI00131CD3D7|nr:SitI3 family protein [Saccharothrix deserti]